MMEALVKPAKHFEALEVGYNIPAEVGMPVEDVHTPCLIVDLDAFEENVERMRRFCIKHQVSLRAHGKMHKSADVARYQIEQGGAIGICVQKVAEAEAFARSGIQDILITNQVRDPRKIQRLVRLPKLGARITCCVDQLSNVDELSNAAIDAGTTINCLVELECGAGRCGVTSEKAAMDLATTINQASGLIFSGIQAYNGDAQHLEHYDARKQAFALIEGFVSDVIARLEKSGLQCTTVSGGGTGSFEFEGTSTLFTELQCGSYAFMDAAYGRLINQNGGRFSGNTFEHALFVLASIVSDVQPGGAVCDAGLKAYSTDSSLPVVADHKGLTLLKCSDEHGVLADPHNSLRANDKLKLIPGHCDPTCNLHDW